MEGSVQKFCCICGLDVRRVRRTKDRRGNYYCKPCYTTRLAAYRQRLSELAAQSRAGTIVVVQPARPSRMAEGDNRFVSVVESIGVETASEIAPAHEDAAPVAHEGAFADREIAPEQECEPPPEGEPRPEQAADDSEESQVHLVSVQQEPVESEVSTPGAYPPLVLEARVWRPPRPHVHPGRKLSTCIVPIAVCALLALCLDRSAHVRLAALLGLIGCGAAVAVTWGPGPRGVAGWRARMRELAHLLFILGLICVGAFGAFQVGAWRAGAWGGAWMCGAVVLAGALWLAWRSRSGDPRPVRQKTLAEAVPLKPSPLQTRFECLVPAGSCAPSSADEPEVETSAKAIVQVKRRLRRLRGGAGRDVRISDLLCPEAIAEVEAAKLRPDQYRDPDVPFSPVTNPPVTDLVNEFSDMIMPQPART